MLRKVLGLLVVVLFLSTLLPVYAQDDRLPLAAVTNNQLYVYGFGETPILVEVPSAASFNNLMWSPDGTTLAFTAFDPTTFHSVMIYTPDQPSATPLVSQISTAMPINFSVDGSQIIYATPTMQMTEDMMGSIHQVYSVAPTAGAVPQPIGQFAFSAGCGGGSSYPADWKYWTESNGLGGHFLTLALTPFGVIHSMNCTGNGIGLLDLATGIDTVLAESLSHVVVSPDRTQVVGLGGDGKLTLVDLATKQIMPLASTAIPDQIAWGASGSIFYSVRTASSRQIVEGEAERLKIAQALGYMDATMLDLPIWEVAIHHYNVNDHTDTQIYAGEAYAVGRMIVASDGSTLVFSQVPNIQAWAQAIIDGSFDPMSGSSVDEYVYTTLYSLNLTDNSVSEIGRNLTQAALNPVTVAP